MTLLSFLSEASRPSQLAISLAIFSSCGRSATYAAASYSVSNTSLLWLRGRGGRCEGRREGRRDQKRERERRDRRCRERERRDRREGERERRDRDWERRD